VAACDTLVVGGGIGGLASALSLARDGHSVQVLEQADAFTEVGAGVQLGPNSTRLLEAWGLAGPLRTLACAPAHLQVRSAHSASQLATLPLGDAMQQRYGAPYLTIARPDLHQVLLKACEAKGVSLQLCSKVTRVRQDAHGVTLGLDDQTSLDAAVAVAADGVWSGVRTQVLDDGVARATGHIAYRALVRQGDLAPALRSMLVTAWLGKNFHAVQYPVRSGDWLNVVVIVHGAAADMPPVWDCAATARDVRQQLAGACVALRDLLEAIEAWRSWPLYDRAPMQSAAQLALGRIALLGDAAHPMPPYLAQGAGMAIEDAQELANGLHDLPHDPPAALLRYAHARWQRNARVQARARRNGLIFHMAGLQGVGRDLALRVLGPQLLDMPWLYGGGPLPR